MMAAEDIDRRRSSRAMPPFPNTPLQRRNAQDEHQQQPIWGDMGGKGER